MCLFLGRLSNVQAAWCRYHISCTFHGSCLVQNCSDPQPTLWKGLCCLLSKLFWQLSLPACLQSSVLFLTPSFFIISYFDFLTYALHIILVSFITLKPCLPRSTWSELLFAFWLIFRIGVLEVGVITVFHLLVAVQLAHCLALWSCLHGGRALVKKGFLNFIITARGISFKQFTKV